MPAVVLNITPQEMESEPECGMQSRANKAYKGRLRPETDRRISAYDVFSAYNESDPIAVSVLHKAIEMWGMASANLVSLLNPQKIIWGGGVFGPASIFIDDIYKEACKWAQPLSIKQMEFVASQLSGNAGLIELLFSQLKSTCMSNLIALSPYYFITLSSLLI